MFGSAARWVIAGVLLGLPACSADGFEHEQPTIETLGAFVARRDGEVIHLYRTLGALHLQDGDVVLEMIAYQPDLPSFEAAEQAARRRDLEVRDTSVSFLRSLFEGAETRVVWFRTLEEHERGIL